MVLIDANVILRFLLQDQEESAQKAKEIIISGAYTLPEVIAEVICVLSGVYHVEKKDINTSLQDLLDDIDIPDKDIIRYAIKLYCEKNLDFVDCVLIAHNRINGVDIFSFDKKLCKEISSQT